MRKASYFAGLAIAAVAFASNSLVVKEANAAAGRCGENFSWIVDAGSLNQSQSVFPLSAQAQVFDQRCSFLIVGAGSASAYSGWWAIKTKSIASIATIGVDASSPGIQAILYDPENWSFTPVNEQSNPAAATCAAAAVVHANSKLLIATPGINLASVLNPGGAARSGDYAAFAETGVAGAIAKCADVYEIQAQELENETERFEAFVSTVAAQVRAANPNIVIMVGLSTNPPGLSGLTGQVLYNAVESVASITDGFYLAIPADSPGCPSCGPPQPQIAVELLNLLASRN